MKTVIMAGGKGTRIASMASDIPKPMIPICGKPILEHQIINLVKSNLNDILIIVGHLGNTIIEYFNNGEKFNANIDYYVEKVPLGTAGGILKCLDGLSDSFLLINGDIIFDLDFRRLISYHEAKNALATLVTHPNSHPFDSALVNVDKEGVVTKWLNKEDNRDFYHNLVNSGIHILTKELLKTIKENMQKDKIDLDRDILMPLVYTQKIYSYKTPEYIKDVGTPERFKQVEFELGKDIPKTKNLSNKQKAVFLDRDGTINILKGFITKPENFSLIPDVPEAIKKINALGYLVIIVTNQPVIARGECTEDELDIIHMKMETELGKGGAYIDDLFYCPHHPDRGFPGERAEYKADCECRKPKPGMLFDAAKKYNINLNASWMVGDDERDIKAGKNAGCKTAFVNNSVNNVSTPDLLCKNLLSFAENLV